MRFGLQFSNISHIKDGEKETKRETRCSLLKTARLGTYLDVSSLETPSSYNRKDEHCKVIKIIQIA